MFPLSPVGFNFGIPPANKPPSDMGPPLLELVVLLLPPPPPLLLLLIALELLALLLFVPNEKFVDSPFTFPAKQVYLISCQLSAHNGHYTIRAPFQIRRPTVVTNLTVRKDLVLPAIAGALLSTVTVFLRVLPVLMDCSKRPLFVPAGGPAEPPACGGGGGGGTDILAILLQRRPRTITIRRFHTVHGKEKEKEREGCIGMRISRSEKCQTYHEIRETEIYIMCAYINLRDLISSLI